MKRAATVQQRHAACSSGTAASSGYAAVLQQLRLTAAGFNVPS